jgi:hypothetical protein
MRNRAAALAASVLGVLVSMLVLAGPLQAREVYRVSGRYVAFCSCAGLCQRALARPAPHTTCAFVAALDLEAGEIGMVPVGGLEVVVVVPPAPKGASARPAAIYVSGHARREQLRAIEALVQDRFRAYLGGGTLSAVTADVAVDTRKRTLRIEVAGVLALSGKALVGPRNSGVQLQGAPGGIGRVQYLAKGRSGRVVDRRVGLRFNGEGCAARFGKIELQSGK